MIGDKYEDVKMVLPIVNKRNRLGDRAILRTRHPRMFLAGICSHLREIPAKSMRG